MTSCSMIFEITSAQTRDARKKDSEVLTAQPRRSGAPEEFRRSREEKSLPEPNKRLPAYNDKSKPLCFKCNTYGHYQGVCTKDAPQQKCYNCKQVGHKKFKCPVKNKIEHKLHVISVHDSTTPQSTFEKPVLVNDKYLLRGLIDSGATCSIIRKSAAQVFQLKSTDCNVELVGFGSEGMGTKPLGTCRANLTIDGVAVEVQLFVTNDTSLSHDLLIGNSFLGHQEVAFLKLGDKFVVGRADQAPFVGIELPDTNNNKVMLKAKNKTVVKAYSVLRVQTMNGQCEVTVSNPRNIDILYKSGQCVARAQPIEQVYRMTDISTEETKPLLTRDDINVDVNTSNEVVEQLLNLFNNYRDSFADSLSEIGCTQLAEMKIEEISGSKPVRSKPYPTSASERQAIAEIVAEWKKLGIATETDSATCSIIKKSAAQVFQLKSTDCNVELVGFGSEGMGTKPLGTCRANLTIDGVAVEVQLFVTKDTLLSHDLLIGNSFLGHQEVAFLKLGDKFVVGRADQAPFVGIELPDTNNNKVMLKAKNKTVVKAYSVLRVQTMNGQCEVTVSNPRNIDILYKSGQCVARAQPIEQVYRMTDISTEETKPLLTRDDINVDVNTSNEVVEQLLNLFNNYRDNACSIGLAAMLLQEGEDNAMHLVYCISKKNSATEEHYHSSKLELAAIAWALSRLRQFLIGISFIVVTDCEALVYMNAKKIVNPQFAGWFALTQEFDMEVKHRPGTRMAHVDALSRAPVEGATETIDNLVSEKLNVCLTLTWEEQVLTMQRSDPEMKTLIQILEIPENQRSRDEKMAVKNFNIINGVVYRKIEEGGVKKFLFVVPPTMRKGLVVKAHDLGGHFGLERTVAKLMEHYWFPGMRRYVKYHVNHCFECLTNKKPSRRRPGILNPIPLSKRPFETVLLDHLGPFVTSSRGNKFLLIAADKLIKYIRLYPTKDTSARSVKVSLQEFIQRHGLPERWVTDRGTAFTAQTFQSYCSDIGVLHVLVST
ncbi:hypothetical protein B566_EDAN013236 [Ephemera danica]|nr:hypothetical protein B566_EDAN013236 [Ephemera danica]